MSASLLTVVPASPAKDSAAESLAQRIRRLQAEAGQMAREHVHTLEEALFAIAKMAEEIAGGGEAYPPGARELAKRLAEEAPRRAQALEAIIQRESH